MEVRVKLLTTGICRSDIHYLRGVWAHPKPVILGHEACGIIESVGPGVPKSRIGEKVVLTFTPSCGHCRFCVIGRSVLCEEVARAAAAGTMWDNTTRFFAEDGSPIHHLSLVSSFCEYTVVPHNGAIRVEHETSPEQACLLGCGAMAGIGAALNTAQVRPGDRVAVFGCGGVGLSVVQGAKLCNALPHRSPSMCGPRRKPKRAISAPRISSTLRWSIRCRRCARSPMAAPISPSRRPARPRSPSYATRRPAGPARPCSSASRPRMRMAGFPPYWIAQDENRVIGSSYGSTRPMIDFPKALRLVKHGLLDLESLVSEVWPFERINEAIALVETGSVNRMVLRFEEAN